MVSTQLAKFLEDFVDNDYEQFVLLIDGKWGSGKTYKVNDFLEKTDYPSAYLSLFGINNVDELVLRLGEYLDSSYITNINGHYEIVSAKETEITFNGNLIVFDDLERANSDFKYSSLYGVIDYLKHFGFRIICIVNSENIDSKSDFESFKEKVVDMFASVSADPSLFSDIVGDIELTLEYARTILKDVNENWRTIIRASKLFKRIILEVPNHISSSLFFQNIGITQEDFFRCCCLADMCFFSNDSAIPEINNDFTKLAYNEFVGAYGRNAANCLFKIFYINKENRSLMQTVEELIALLKTNDYDLFIGNYIKKDDPLFDSLPILRERPLYLSDYKRNQYKKAFIDNINKMDLLKVFHKQKMNEFLHIYLDSLSKKHIDIVCKKIVNDVPTNESDEFIMELLYDYNGLIEKAELFKKQLADLFLEKKKKENFQALHSLFERKDYSEMLNFIYQKRYEYGISKDIILKAFLDNGFFLPDLSRGIDYHSWSFCNEVARFVADKEEYRNAFINVLKKQCKLHPNSSSLKDRCNRLGRYNLNLPNNFFDDISGEE